MNLQKSKSWHEAKLHQIKVRYHQARRILKWRAEPESFPYPTLCRDRQEFTTPTYARKVVLRRTDPDSHTLLEDGKVSNIKLAAPCFDGLELGPGRPLSFWKALGRIEASRGFRHGMEIRAGCVVPALGGGLCLLSNALFEMAAKLDWKILERHGHTVEAVPSRSLPWGLDATIFWPYVDLRVEPRTPSLLQVWVKDDALWLSVTTQEPWTDRVELSERAATEESGLRCNQLWRHVWNESEELLREEMVGENRKRVLHQGVQRRRNCLTCQEHGCRARVVL